MELLQLRYFAESAKTENFSITAEKHVVPVSSVSASVRKLEKELGCTLFDRNKNRLTLNQNGKLFYDDVNAALNLIDSAVEKVSLREWEELGSINMLIRTKKSSINEKLIDFVKKNERVSFHLTHNYLPVNYNEYDLIVDEQSNIYKGFVQKPIIKEKIKIAASKKNPLYGRPLILSDLQHCAFITLSESSSLNKITKEVCQKAGFNPNIIIESDDSDDIRKYIEADFGIAFVSETLFLKGADDKVSFLEVTDFDYSRVTFLYLNNHSKVSRAAKLFFDGYEALG